MNYKQIFVEDVFATSKNDEYECRVVINKFSSLRKSVAIGESLVSNEFSLIFPNSIGESKWKLAFYPNGQYVDEGRVDGFISIYLVMLSCEREDDALSANVSFQLKSQNGLDDGRVRNLKAEFVYWIPSKRWIGDTKFASKKWLNSKRGEHFFASDTLSISCVVGETSHQNDQIEMNVISSDGNKIMDHESHIDMHDVQNNHVSERCEVDDFQKEISEWSTVSYGKGKKKLPENHSNVESSKPKPKSSV